MLPNPLSGVPCRRAFRSLWTGLVSRAGLLFLLGAVLSAGCVNKEKYESEKVRSLNFQRLLAQEEKRANTLDAKLAHKEEEINELNARLKETKDTIASLESQNRDLTVEVNTLKAQSGHQAEPEPVQDSTAPSNDSGPSRGTSLSEPSFSDPFMSEEDLMKMLGAQPK